MFLMSCIFLLHTVMPSAAKAAGLANDLFGTTQVVPFPVVTGAKAPSC